MIEVVLIFVGALLVLPAGLSFVVDKERKPKKKEAPVEVVIEEPEPDPEPVLVARLKATKKVLVTVVPVCFDDGSEGRLRAASLDFLGQVEGLPEETVFEVQDCADEGVVDIQIIETIEKD